MKTDVKKEMENPFGDWINSVAVGDLPKVRAKVIQKCKISKQVFRHWRAGNSKVPTLAKPIVEKIAGKQIFKVE